MNVRDLWYSINKTGKLSVFEFKIFCSIVNLELAEQDYQKIVHIFGKTITYQNFKLFLKFS